MNLHRSRCFGQPDKNRGLFGQKVCRIRQMLMTAGTAAYVAPNWIGRPDGWDNQNGRWQAAGQSGRLVEADERQQWSHLLALEGVAHPSSTLIDAARPALMQAIADDKAIRIRIDQTTNARRGMGIAPVRSP